MDGEITTQKSTDEVSSQEHQPGPQHNDNSETGLLYQVAEDGGCELSQTPGHAGSNAKEASKRKKVRTCLLWSISHKNING